MNTELFFDTDENLRGLGFKREAGGLVTDQIIYTLDLPNGVPGLVAYLFTDGFLRLAHQRRALPAQTMKDWDLTGSGDNGVLDREHLATFRGIVYGYISNGGPAA